MKDLMQHRGHYGSVHFDDEDLIFHGKIEFIRALVTYEATEAKSLRQAFEQAVDDYFEMCERNEIKPEKPFKGSFNIRVKPELHRMLAMAANMHDVNFNAFIAETLENAVSALQMEAPAKRSQKKIPGTTPISHRTVHYAMKARKVASKRERHQEDHARGKQ